jgi:hypothetical protein
LIAKKYSKVQDGTVVAVAESTSQSQTIPFETVTGYVAIVYEDYWWPGYVLEKYEGNEEFTTIFLHPHGPSSSFVFLSQSDDLTLPVSSFLSMVAPKSKIGRTYKLSSAEANHMCK